MARPACCVEAGDNGALARGLETLIRDPALRQRLGEAGYRRVQAQFDMEKGIDLLLDRFAPGRRLSRRPGLRLPENSQAAAEPNAHCLLRAAEAAHPSGAVGRPAHGPALDGGAGAGRSRGDPDQPSPQLGGPGDAARQDSLARIGQHTADRLVSSTARRRRSSGRRPGSPITSITRRRTSIGPRVSAALDIPYLVAEASHAPKRAGGSWAKVHEAAQDAIARPTRSSRSIPMTRNACGRWCASGACWRRCRRSSTAPTSPRPACGATRSAPSSRAGSACQPISPGC